MPDLGGSDSTVVLGAIAVLLTALGLSSASGLRAYFPLFAVALDTSELVPGDLHVIHLSKPFQQLVGQQSPWVLVALLAVLALGEFFVDKVPGLDHASDAIHTLIRPLAGAIVMAGISNPVSENDPWVAAAVGAILALAVHGVKAVARPAVTVATVGMGNPVVSLLEDVAMFGMTVASLGLLLLAPLLAVLGFAVLLLGGGWLLVRGVRWIFGRRRHSHSYPSAPAAGWPAHPSSASPYGPDGGYGPYGGYGPPGPATSTMVHVPHAPRQPAPAGRVGRSSRRPQAPVWPR